MKIAVTGGIGAGKSEFMRAVRELGVTTYSCDEINADLLSDENYVKKLASVFPFAVKDGKVDKSILRTAVFSDEGNKKKLENLSHPEIRKKIEEISGDAVVEVPLLFESGMTDLFDKIVVVTAPEDERIRRICDTRGISKDMAKSIIKNQTTDDERKKRADFFVMNDGSLETFHNRAKEIIERTMNYERN